jgi:hypothetical protein
MEQINCLIVMAQKLYIETSLKDHAYSKISLLIDHICMARIAFWAIIVEFRDHPYPRPSHNGDSSPWSLGSPVPRRLMQTT